MQRSKLLAALVAFVASGVAAFLVIGGASASSWHVYKGDLYAGHAYGIDVPEDAQSLEFLLAGDDAASSASLGVYAPDGDRLGVYDLTTMTTSAAVANPDAGRYVVYVYDLTGALSVRVDAEDEPALDLQTLPLVREDVTIGRFESARLDKIVTSDLDAAPVFVTLLYEGSARALDATVSSEKGDVVLVRGETGTAFAPGVWTSLKGERSFQARHLDGTLYTVKATAEQFEGTLVLSTLSIDFSVPMSGPGFAPPPLNMSPPSAPVHHPDHAPDGGLPGAFPLLEGAAIAFTAQPGTLHLADPALLESTERRDDCSYTHGLVTLYAPDDSVVAVVELNHDEPTALVDLKEAGEYVAYVTHAQKGVLLGHLPGQAFPTIRNLEIAQESFEVRASSLLVGAPETIELAHVPVALGLDVDALSVAGSVGISNELGYVAYGNSFVGLPGMPGFATWTHQLPQHFLAGEHAVEVGGVFEGTLSLLSLHYLRESEIPLVAEGDAEEEADDSDADEEPAEPSEPSEPWWPMPPEPSSPEATPATLGDLVDLVPL